VAVLGAGLGIATHRAADVVSPHVVAVMLGVLLANTGVAGGRLRPGLAFAARTLVRAGVVVLGFRLSMGDVVRLGPRAVVLVVVIVALTFVGVQWLGRRLGLSPALSLLVATGSSICGASAIAAVHPFSDADEEELAYALALVTLCGTLAIGILPAVGSLLGLSDATFGAWVGSSVHDVGQVVATASTRADGTVAEAVLVKLTRVALLAPLLAIVAMQQRARTLGAATGGPRPPVLPLFVALFLAASAVRTAGILGDDLLLRLKDLEVVLLGAGLVGLGSGVRLRRLAAVGGRPLVLGLVSWALIAVVSLGAVLAAGIH
jgi:uncharacterized integral membrane protein (TIGR00698 family)